MSIVFLSSIFCSLQAQSQTKEDTLAIRQAALDYIESQHKPNPQQMARAIHPLLEKRTFWLNKKAAREFIYENNSEGMVMTAEFYNKSGDKFSSNPQKDVVLLDVMDKTASVKLIADTWIDYMHLVKVNGEWKIINVLWQYKDSKQHQ